MAYQMYTTRALVCGSYHRNTSDSSYRLFTEQFGMLYASARSVREERSRQRYALQDFSFLRISLVRGKAEWKIGSVVPIHNPFFAVTDREGRRAITNILRLHNRYVQGEVESAAIFNLLWESFRSIADGKVANLQHYELGVVFRLLYLLGYVAPETEQKKLLEAPLSTIDYLWDDGIYKSIKKAVENASVVSQL